MPTRYEVLPIPALMTHTELYSAGPIQLGVEYRLLNEEIIAEEFGPDAREQFGKNVPPDMQSQVDEDGVSIHVFNKTGRREFLRFDCFEDYPHYHYIENDVGHQTVHGYDAAAHGPMDEWVIECITLRLPEMLRKAGEAKLAQELDPHAIEQILPQVVLAIERAREAGRPILVAQSSSNASE
jgi:hypothetical protein